MTADSDLLHVKIMAVPVDLWHRARVWFEGLLREFDILVAETDDTAPRELVEFVATSRERFGRFTHDSNAVLEEAFQRGEASVDVELSLPPAAASIARQLWHLIEQVQEYCRRGDLLTLTPDEEVRAYVEWYLHELADQLEGAEPTPWRAQPPTR